MIDRYELTVCSEVHCENPETEIWRRIRHFLHEQSVAQEIARRQEVDSQREAKRLRKQAIQIGYCIRQAEQYFKSAQAVDLTTRATHLYYGAVSLSRAVVLMNRDGSYSFDALRKSFKHAHHGLELVRNRVASIGADASAEEFFSKLRCRVHFQHQDPRTLSISDVIENGACLKDQTNGGWSPWGHFGLVYDSIAPPAYTLAYKEYSNDRQGNLVGQLPRPGTLCRAELSKEIRVAAEKSAEGNRTIKKVTQTYTVYVNEIWKEAKQPLINRYVEQNPGARLIEDLGKHLHIKLYNSDPQAKASINYYPDAIEDMTGRTYLLTSPDTYLPEPIGFLAILYCLSMMSRYYPDVWVRALDRNSYIAELSSAFLSVAARKFPQLMLDQLALQHFYVHL